MRKDGRNMNDDMKMVLDEIRKLRGDMQKMEGSIRGDMQKMEDSIRGDMRKMETSLRQEIHDGDQAIRLILENDIRPKINILAESHLDLNRKLDEIRRNQKKNELLPLRVSLLEKDVREIKKHLAMPV